MNKLFVFDLDDTLMLNGHHYSEAFLEFYKYLMRVWDKKVAYIGSVARIQEDIDVSLGDKINPITETEYGFSMERFPESLVQTYKTLCKDHGHDFDEDVADKVYSIGMTAFNVSNYTGFMPHAKATLKFLDARGDTLVLLTKGDIRVQDPKINMLELDNWFVRTMVVDKKSVDIFKAIKEDYEINPNTCFSVGNSFYSDIKPALEAGFTGIYVPCATWKAEAIPSEYDTENVFTLDSIKELMEIYNNGNLDEKEVSNEN